MCYSETASRDHCESKHVFWAFKLRYFIRKGCTSCTLEQFLAKLSPPYYSPLIGGNPTLTAILIEFTPSLFVFVFPERNSFFDVLTTVLSVRRVNYSNFARAIGYQDHITFRSSLFTLYVFMSLMYRDVNNGNRKKIFIIIILSTLRSDQ